MVEERREERAHQHSSHSQSPCGPHKMSAVFLDADRRNQSASQLTRSPATERGQKKKPIDLRTRYWKFLFDNFQRAVDSIYQMCEQDESVVECRVSVCLLVRLLCVDAVKLLCAGYGWMAACRYGVHCVGAVFVDMFFLRRFARLSCYWESL